MEADIGTIVLFAGDYAPLNWAVCDGSELSVTEYSSLYSVLGTTYGGDGVKTFTLPDLRGRAPVQPGHGPGLSEIRLGEHGGHDKITLQPSHLPAHSHQVACTTALGSQDSPVGAIPAAEDVQADSLWSDQAANEFMREDMVTEVGDGLPFHSRSPYLAINYIIAVRGTFPVRGN